MNKIDNSVYLQFARAEYTSAVDGLRDWYLFRPGNARLCVVVLHGHGSQGDELVTEHWRERLRDWHECLNELDASVLCPNLRDHSWMSASAVADFAALLRQLKARHPWEQLVIASGSMGGTGALIFASRHPELVDGVVALGAAAAMPHYAEWCAQPGRLPVCGRILEAIRAAYPTPESLAAHDVCAHADSLRMPVLFYQGVADEVIPASEAIDLAERLKDKSDFHLTLVPDGNHDSPLHYFREGLTRILAILGAKDVSKQST